MTYEIIGLAATPDSLYAGLIGDSLSKAFLKAASTKYFSR
jgi:hypothetical protein